MKKLVLAISSLLSLLSFFALAGGTTVYDCQRYTTSDGTPYYICKCTPGTDANAMSCQKLKAAICPGFGSKWCI